MSTSLLPTTQEEFDLVMEAIDERLRKRGIPIPSRYLIGALEYTRQFGIEIPVLTRNSCGRDGVFHGIDADAHIQRWFDTRYGDRQKKDVGLSSMVVTIRGEAWEMAMPRIYGTVHRVADPDIARYDGAPSLARPGDPPVVLNVLALIKDLPNSFASQFSRADCVSALRQFECGLRGCHAIGELRGLPLIAEAAADLDAAGRHMMATPAHHGQARYAASQAAEKHLKCVLQVKGQLKAKGAASLGPKVWHNIEELALLTEAAGMPAIQQPTLQHASASSGMRYGEVDVTLSEAVSAQNAAFDIAYLVFRFVGPLVASA